MGKEFKIDLITADDFLFNSSCVCGYSAGEEALFILRSKNVTPSARRYALKVKTEELIQQNPPRIAPNRVPWWQHSPHP